MAEWPDGWEREDARRSGPSARPRQLPPELDPRGGRPRPRPVPDHRVQEAGVRESGADPRVRAAYAPYPPPAGAPGGPPGPGGPGGGAPFHPTARSPRPARRRRRPRFRPVRTVALLALLTLLWVTGLAVWGVSRLERVDALSGAPGTPGRTWLLVGSDSREGLTAEEQDVLNTGSTEGRRTDTIMLLHIPRGTGEPTLVSLPRDSYVEIPGQGPGKLNAAYSAGGPALLVATVEAATGLTVDDYMEIGFGGFVGLTDAVGGVELCPEQAIRDERAGLDIPAGCQDLTGGEALGYVRARYSDPRGDLGRVERQQEFLAAVAGKVSSWRTLANPVRHFQLVRSGTDSVRVDQETGALDLAWLAWNARRVFGGEGVRTTVPVADPDYRPGGVGSTVLWDEVAADQLFEDLLAGREVAVPEQTPGG